MAGGKPSHRRGVKAGQAVEHRSLAGAVGANVGDSDMDFNLETNGQECSISLSGRLTFNDHARMRALIKEASRRDVTKVLFDLSALEFIDSAGVGMILIAREELDGHQKKLTLRKATGQVKRVITVAQLSKLVEIDNYE